DRGPEEEEELVEGEAGLAERRPRVVDEIEKGREKRHHQCGNQEGPAQGAARGGRRFGGMGHGAPFQGGAETQIVISDLVLIQIDSKIPSIPSKKLHIAYPSSSLPWPSPQPT